ncbi:Hint domain-containing protein [Pseudoroseicyclus sp. H15]
MREGAEPIEAAAREELAVGFPAGALVLTLDGEERIEQLMPGSRIITLDSGMARLNGLKVTKALHRPVCIRAAALGHFRPEADVTFGAGTQVHLRDWRAEAIYGTSSATVAAELLVEDAFITREPPQNMTLYSLSFDHPHIVYIAGLEILMEG